MTAVRRTGRELRGIVLPGVFAPRSDSWLLAAVARREPLPAGARVLELCAGPAFAGVARGARRAASLTTVDVSRRAVLERAPERAGSTACRSRALRGDLFEAVGDERFDLILANPPYVPGPPPPDRGPARAWDAGEDGRAVVDRICAEAPRAPAPGRHAAARPLRHHRRPTRRSRRTRRRASSPTSPPASAGRSARCCASAAPSSRRAASCCRARRRGSAGPARTVLRGEERRWPMSDTLITPYRDGPLLVRGPFRLVDQDGNEIVDRGARRSRCAGAASRACGRSATGRTT